MLAAICLVSAIALSSVVDQTGLISIITPAPTYQAEVVLALQLQRKLQHKLQLQLPLELELYLQ